MSKPGPKQLEMLAKLRQFVHAGYDLLVALDLARQEGDEAEEAFCKGYPKFLPSFDEAFNDLTQWRDAVAEAMGEPAGSETHAAAVKRTPVVAVGTRVVFTESVERFPHFIIPEGTTGTVTEANPEAGYSVTMYGVKVDGEVPGLTDSEEWKGELAYVREDFDSDGGVLPFKPVEGP